MIILRRTAEHSSIGIKAHLNQPLNMLLHTTELSAALRQTQKNKNLLSPNEK
ncbi:MAG: hypothetical protein KBT12_04175 [Bacteroidales bacterium]|nr:hypothetical protein [Candidatus Physcousia equi]